MNSNLPATGTAELLELLAPLVPDDFIDQCWPTGYTGGRHREYSASPLYRVHLLSLLSPVHSLNLLVKMLPEQRAWRKFAGLPAKARCLACACCTSSGHGWAWRDCGASTGI